MIARQPHRAQRRGRAQRPEPGPCVQQRPRRQHKKEEAEQKAVTVREPHRLLEAVPDQVDAVHPEAEHQRRQHPGACQLFPTGHLAREEEQHRQHGAEHAAVDVGQAVRHVLPEEVAEEELIQKLRQGEVGPEGEVHAEQSALGFLDLHQRRVQEGHGKPRRQHARGREGAKAAAQQPAAAPGEAGAGGPVPEEVEHAEQAHLPGGVEVQQDAGEHQPEQRPVAAGVHQLFQRPQHQRRQHHHVHPDDVLAVHHAIGAQGVALAQNGQKGAGAVIVLLHKEAEGRAGAGGAQKEHQLHHLGDHAGGGQQYQQIEGAGHIVGEQAQGTAAAEF